jgi:hypothetical protein
VDHRQWYRRCNPRTRFGGACKGAVAISLKLTPRGLQILKRGIRCRR